MTRPDWCVPPVGTNTRPWASDEAAPSGLSNARLCSACLCRSNSTPFSGPENAHCNKEDDPPTHCGHHRLTAISLMIGIIGMVLPRTLASTTPARFAIIINGRGQSDPLSLPARILCAPSSDHFHSPMTPTSLTVLSSFDTRRRHSPN